MDFVTKEDRPPDITKGFVMIEEDKRTIYQYTGNRWRKLFWRSLWIKIRRINGHD